MATFHLFPNLPNEIKLHIIETADPEDIQNFALCCKQVYDLAGKTLSQHKTDKNIWSDLSFCFNGGYPDKDCIQAFLNLSDIATNSRLQRYPKHVTMTHRIYSGPLVSPSSSQIKVKEAWDTISQAFVSPYISRGEMDVWYNNIMSHQIDHHGAFYCYKYELTTTLSLLLTLLPNVERITIDCLEQLSRQMANMIHTISRINQDSPPFMSNRLSLTKLLEVNIRSCSPFNDECGVTGVLEAFMTLPSLQVLRLGGVGPGYEFNKWLDSTPHSNVTEIHCTRAALKARNLTRILEHVKCLRVFSYDHETFYLGGSAWRKFSPGAILETLLQHAKTSLTYLNYTTNARTRIEAHNLGYVSRTRIGPVGSFRGFEVLKTLRLSHIILFEDVEEEIPKKLVDELPASLEELELVEEISREEAQVMFADMLEMKQERLPNLRYIAFEGSVPFDEETVRAYEHAGLMLDCTIEDAIGRRVGFKKTGQVWLGGVECRWWF